MQDEIVTQLGTFGTFFSKPGVLFCIFALCLYLMYVGLNYLYQGYRNKGINIILLSFFLGLSLGGVWAQLHDQTLRIYTKKIDTLKSEISSMKQEALNRELREESDKADRTCKEFGFTLSLKGKCEPSTSDIKSFVEELDIKKGIAQDLSKNVRDMIYKTPKEQSINLKKLVIKVFQDQDMNYYKANKDELDQVAEDIVDFSFNYLGEWLKILKLTRKDGYTYILLDTKNSGFTPEQLTRYKNDTKNAAEKHNVLVLFND